MTDAIKREELGLPWKLDVEEEVILNRDGFCATVLSKGKTGAFIVTAANAHHELVEALRAADAFIRNGTEFGYIQFPRDVADPAHKTPALIRAALASAEGGVS